MRKLLLIHIICFLILVEVVYSAVVEVGIVEELEGKISSINYDNTSNLVKFSIEFYNTGSVPYKTKIKTEIFNNSKLIFNGWSKEREMMSGDKKSFDIYWYSKESGEYSVRLNSYFGDEIIKYKKFDLIINKKTIPEDVFEIKNLRTYDNYIIFDLQSKENVEDVIIMPHKYISGWIFEQKKIDSIAKDSSKLVIVNYYPSLWKSSNLTLLIASDRGKYYTEETIEMEKNRGLIGFLYYIIDSLRIAFS